MDGSERESSGPHLSGCREASLAAELDIVRRHRTRRMRYLAFALASALTACRPGTDAHVTERPARPTSSAENGVIAVLTAVALYGPGSGVALATVVGVLVEVLVMLSVCSICNRTCGWFGPEPVLAPVGGAHV